MFSPCNDLLISFHSQAEEVTIGAISSEGMCRRYPYGTYGRSQLHNITMKREFMYIEDVKEAININTLEERIKLKRWFISKLKTHSKDKLVEAL